VCKHHQLMQCNVRCYDDVIFIICFGMLLFPQILKNKYIYSYWLFIVRELIYSNVTRLCAAKEASSQADNENIENMITQYACISRQHR